LPKNPGYVVGGIAAAVAVGHRGWPRQPAEAGEDAAEAAFRGLGVGLARVLYRTAGAGQRSGQCAEPAGPANLLDDLREHVGRKPALLGRLLDRVTRLAVRLGQRPDRGLGHRRVDPHLGGDSIGGLLSEALHDSVENTHGCDS